MNPFGVPGGGPGAAAPSPRLSSLPPAIPFLSAPRRCPGSTRTDEGPSGKAQVNLRSRGNFGGVEGLADFHEPSFWLKKSCPPSTRLNLRISNSCFSHPRYCSAQTGMPLDAKTIEFAAAAGVEPDVLAFLDKGMCHTYKDVALLTTCEKDVKDDIVAPRPLPV